MASNIQTSANNQPILKLSGITKKFPGVLANDNVSFEIFAGEILAILGENGAGKSTLMKILSGLYQPESGTIEIAPKWFRGNNVQGIESLIPYKISNPRVAIQLGIGQVFQHFKLIETMNVTENIILGKEFVQKGIPLLDEKLAEAEIRKLGVEYGLPIDPSAIIENLPVGLQQRVEILKQLFRNAQLFIFDEPTAVLTPTEVDAFFKTLKELKAAGKTIIFISHKLKEPLAIADRIIVMRGGKLIGETDPSKATEASLAEMLVGRHISLRMDRKDIPPGNPVLRVKNLSIKDIRFDGSEGSGMGRNAVDNASFVVNEHEIVGVAGVQGNGQTELIEGLMGLRIEMKGSIQYYSSSEESSGEEMVGMSTLEILEKGIAYIPEDRTKRGIIQEFPIYENTWLGYHTQPIMALSFLENGDNSDQSIETDKKDDGTQPNKGGIFLPIQLMKDFASKVIKGFNIATPDIYVSIKNLSGGNQQKVILGREFAKNPRLIIASQPTRGVDIGVTEKVRSSLLAMRDNGAGILLISSDLDEVLALADKILVLYEGKIVGQGSIEEMPIERISQLMTAGIDIGPKRTDN